MCFILIRGSQLNRLSCEEAEINCRKREDNRKRGRGSELHRDTSLDHNSCANMLGVVRILNTINVQLKLFRRMNVKHDFS
jgi:hypothetical protein